MKKGDIELNKVGAWILAIVFLLVLLSISVMLLQGNAPRLIENFFGSLG